MTESRDALVQPRSDADTDVGGAGLTQVVLRAAAVAALLGCYATLGEAQTSRFADSPVRAAEPEWVATLRGKAQDGDIGAQYQLGELHESGADGVAVNLRMAFLWFRRAAEGGHPAAQSALGAMHAFGQGTPVDHAAAVAWYRKAADQGDPRGQNNLGEQLARGLGVVTDYQAAVSWYRRAAEKGYAPAMANLGYMFEHGRGVKQDSVQAAKWFRSAADRGDPQGQYNLALAYKDGAGVAHDPAEAVRWCRRAAEQGFARAAYAMGVSYRDGYVMDRDPADALAWFSVAAARASGSEQAEFSATRDALAATLTREQAAAAHERARAILHSLSSTK